MAYDLTSYDFVAFPGATVQTDTAPFSVLPDFALMGGKSQYKLTIDATGGDDFSNKKFYFNPALFKPQTIPTPDPTVGVKGFYGDTTGVALATPTLMTIIAPPNDENVKNFTVSFELVTTVQMIITLDFYFIFDILDFITGAPVQDNNKKFRASNKMATVPATGPSTNTANSVYNSPTPKAMWFYFYINSGAYFYSKPGDIKARFYNKGTDNAAPDNPLTVPMSLTVNGSSATQIATNYDTEVEWKFTATAALTKAFAILYRADDIDNSLNYVDDVILGYADIVTAGGAATIDGLIKEPSENSFAAGVGTVKFNIDYTGIVAGAKYYIALLVYDEANTEYTTHLSPEITTFTAPPPAIAPDIISDGLMDYTGDLTAAGAEWGPALIAAIQERIRSRAKFDVADYDAKVVAQYGGGDYLSQLKNVTIKIKDFTTDQLLYTKDLSNGVIQTIVAGVSAEYTNEFRLQHDEANYWGGKTLRIEWVQEFFYSKAFTGLPFDHTDFIVMEQFIEVRDYGTDGYSYYHIMQCPPAGPTEQIVLSNGAVVGSICGKDCAMFCFTRNNGAVNAKILAFIDNRFYSSASIQEEEVFVGNLAQKINDILYDVTEDFTSGVEQCFKIDLDELTEGIQYRVSVTIKYVADPGLGG